MHGPSVLGDDIAQIRQELSRHVSEIAQDLLRSVAFDESRVRRNMAAITTLCHKAAQMIPKVSVAKTDAMRADPSSNMMEWANLERSVFDLRNSVSQWSQIETLIREQIPQKKRLLMEDPNQVTLSQMRQYDAVFDQLHEIFKPQIQTEDARDHGCFADITLPNSTFVAYAHAAYRTLLALGKKSPTRFLDVGCGTGFKVMMAARYFDQCDGLEYDPAYVSAAKRFLRRGGFETCSAFKADGLTYEGYGDYDVLYFYRPMREDDQLQELEAQILRCARPKTLVIAPYRVFETRFERYGCARVCGWLYVTDSSASDAEILRKTAEMTGPFVGKIPPRGQSLWDPILVSSAAKGFGF